MCGMGGAFGRWLSLDERDIFRNISILNVLRGEHSTGMIKVTVNDEIFYDKVAEPSPFYTYSERGDDFIENRKLRKKGKTKGVTVCPNNRVLMVHARHATVGEVNVDNAHPFDKPNVIGMHNGTFKGLFPDKGLFGTDSEALYNSISMLGLKESLKKFNEDSYHPAYALQWIDKKENTLNFIRNKERPLWFYVHPKTDTMYWSSTFNTLYYALAESKLKIVKPTKFEADKLRPFCTVTESGLFTLDENVHMSIAISSDGARFSSLKFATLDVKKSYTGYSNWGMSGVVNTVKKLYTPTIPAKDKEVGTNIQYEGYKEKEKRLQQLSWLDVKPVFEIPKVPKDELEGALTTTPCTACNEISGTGDIYSVFWVSAKDYICKNCLKDETIREYFNVGE